MISFNLLSRLAKEHGSSFFLLDLHSLVKNYRNFYSAFLSEYSSIQVSYSFKTNYIPSICSSLHHEGAYAEVVSDTEYYLARRLGIPPGHIIFNGPCKGESSFLDAALSGTILNIDNYTDLQMLKKASARSEQSIRTVLRINFAFDHHDSRFGFRADGDHLSSVVDTVRALPHVCLLGFHLHLPYRQLHTYQHRLAELIRLSRLYFADVPPEILNIGGGFMSPLTSSSASSLNLTPTSYSEYARVIGHTLIDAFPHPSRPTLFLEPGTALVANVLSFATRVHSIRHLKHKSIATVDGSLLDISPNAKSSNLPFDVFKSSEDFSRDRSYDICGFTCIESDVLSRDYLGHLSEGDFIVYNNIGSYSVVMRPPFIRPPFPILSIAPDTSHSVIRKTISNEDFFAHFNGF